MDNPTATGPFSRSKNREKNIEKKISLHNNQAKKELRERKLSCIRPVRGIKSWKNCRKYLFYRGVILISRYEN